MHCISAVSAQKQLLWQLTLCMVAVSGSGRFELTVKLLNKEAKQAILQIFGFLQMQLSRQIDGLGYTEGQVSQLQLLYSC